MARGEGSIPFTRSHSTLSTSLHQHWQNPRLCPMGSSEVQGLNTVGCE